MRKVLFLFGQLSDEDIEWMLDHGSRRSVPAGAVLIRQGVPIDAIFILLEGKLSVWLAGRTEREIARLNAGEIVGEMSFLDARPPSATVKGLEEATVFAIPRTALAAKLAADLGFAARFYRALAIFLATTVRERHRSLVIGAEAHTAAAPDALAEAEDGQDDADELDANVLDSVYLAGERFNRMVRRLTGA